MKFKAMFVAAALLASGACVQAANATSLFDNFDAENGGAAALNYGGLANFNVTGGSVDLIGVGSGFDFYPGNGLYLDLCGSTGACGTLTSKAVFGPGVYTVTLGLGGNARSSIDDTTKVTFGSMNPTYTLSEFGQETATFTTTLTSAQHLVIADGGLVNGNIGNILLSVDVSPVPEPATWAMMLVGAAGLGVSLRLRRRAVLAA